MPIRESENNTYDLEERTVKFGEEVIVLCKSIKQDAITKPLISQLIHAATSMGG